MYDNEFFFKTKENESRTKDKIEQQLTYRPKQFIIHFSVRY